MVNKHRIIIAKTSKQSGYKYPNFLGIKQQNQPTMFSTKFVFILVAFSLFTVANTSLLNGGLNILGLNILTPCQAIIDIIVLLVRAIAAIGNLMSYINQVTILLVESLLQPLIVAIQTVTLELANTVTMLPGLITNDECLQDMADTLNEEVFSHAPNITVYIDRFVNSLNISDEVQEAQALQSYISQFGTCNRCDCIPRFLAILPEVTLKFGKIVAGDGLVTFVAETLAISNVIVTDFNVYFGRIITGLHTSVTNYQTCLGNLL